MHAVSLLGTELNQELAKRVEHKESKWKDSETDKIWHIEIAALFKVLSAIAPEGTDDNLRCSDAVITLWWLAGCSDGTASGLTYTLLTFNLGLNSSGDHGNLEKL